MIKIKSRRTIDSPAFEANQEAYHEDDTCEIRLPTTQNDELENLFNNDSVQEEVDRPIINQSFINDDEDEGEDRDDREEEEEEGDHADEKDEEVINVSDDDSPQLMICSIHVICIIDCFDLTMLFIIVKLQS